MAYHTRISFRLNLVIILSLFIACETKTDYSKNYNNTSTVAFNLVERCVNAMINFNPLINTENYVLDLSGIDTLNKKGVDSFLAIKQITLPTTADDSAMIFIDGDPSNFRMKQSMIIRIKEIIYKNDKTVLVTASKIKSTNEIINAVIELERHLDNYEVKSFNVTN